MIEPMTSPVSRWCIRSASVLVLTASGAALAQDAPLPWSFINGSANGYSIAPLAIEPVPGTPLCSGHAREFKIGIAYTLDLRDKGQVVLVFQDDEGRAIPRADSKQTSVAIQRGKGEVVLKETITVIKGIKEIRLFVPVVPQGVANTSGELLLRYPVVACS